MTDLETALRNKLKGLPDGVVQFAGASMLAAEQAAVTLLAKRHGRPEEAIREMVLAAHLTVLPEFKEIMPECMKVAGAEIKKRLDAGKLTTHSHKGRMIKERDELDTRIQKLQTFLGGEVFKALDVAEQSRMQIQNRHMCRYWGVLRERIEACQ